MANKTWVGTATPGDWSVAGNWSASGVPSNGDNVRIPAGSSAITAGLNQSAVALGDVIFEEGYAAQVGTSTGYLQIDPDRFEYWGGGTTANYIDLGSAAISIRIYGSPSASTGYRGLYLKGSALATVDIFDGKVGIAYLAHETSTVTTLRVATDSTASVWAGPGLSLTTYLQEGGDNRLYCAATTVTCQRGTLRTFGTGAITTYNHNGGNSYPNSTGTITTMNINAGAVDFIESMASRTVTTLKQNPHSLLRYDPAVLTITNRSAPDHSVRVLVEYSWQG